MGDRARMCRGCGEVRETEGVEALFTSLGEVPVAVRLQLCEACRVPLLLAAGGLSPQVVPL